jgi:hypothetical protein
MDILFDGTKIVLAFLDLLVAVVSAITRGDGSILSFVSSLVSDEK